MLHEEKKYLFYLSISRCAFFVFTFTLLGVWREKETFDSMFKSPSITLHNLFDKSQSPSQILVLVYVSNLISTILPALSMLILFRVL